MSDISCRAWSYFETCEKAGLIDIDELLDGIPVTRQELSVPSNRVPWSIWAQLCERFASLLGSDEAVIASTDAIFSADLTQPLGRVANWFSSSTDIYRTAARWVGPLTYRNMTFVYEPLSDDRIRFAAQLRPTDAPARSLMLLLQGALERIPGFLGHPHAIVEVNRLDGHGADFTVRPPAVRTFGSRINRIYRSLRSSDALVQELDFQHSQLDEAYRALEKHETEFKSTLRSLPGAVAFHHRGNIRFCNEAFKGTFGEPATLIELVHPDDVPALNDLVELTDSTAQNVQLRMKAQDGWRFVLASASANIAFEGVLSTLFVATDITKASSQKMPSRQHDRPSKRSQSPTPTLSFASMTKVVSSISFRALPSRPPTSRSILD